MVDDDSSKGDESETRSPAALGPEHSFGEFRHYVPHDILGVSFPVSGRGYDQAAG